MSATRTRNSSLERREPIPSSGGPTSPAVSTPGARWQRMQWPASRETNTSRPRAGSPAGPIEGTVDAQAPARNITASAERPPPRPSPKGEGGSGDLAILERQMAHALAGGSEDGVDH